MSFQPFAAECPTCGSRLRVTDPSLVGTIASCPKCHSMVQIDAVPTQLTAGSSAVDTGAITEDAIANTDGPDAASPIHNGDQVFTQVNDDQQVAGAAAPIDWQSDRTRRTRQIAMVATLTIGALIVAAIAFGWFVHSYNHKRAAQAQDEAVAVEQSGDDTLPLEGQADPESSIGSDSNRSSPGRVEPQRREGDGAESASRMDSTVPEEEAAEKPQDAIAETSDTAGAATVSEVPSDNGLPLKTEPIVAGTRDPATNDAGADSDAGKLQDLPPGLAQYIPFLLQEGPSEKPTLKAPPTMDEVPIDNAAEDDLDPLAKVEPRKLDLKADLALQMAFRSEGYPLSDLMLLIGQATGVPIQVDWVSFDLLGIDVDRMVQLPSKPQTMRQVLELVRTQCDAQIRELETLLIVTVADDSFESTFMRITNRDDFGAGSESAAAVLTDFLRGEPDEPADEDLEATEAAIKVSDASTLRSEKQLAALSTETLRRMRSLPTQMDVQRLNRWTQVTASRSTDWPKVNAGETGQQPDTPIALAGFLRRVARQNGASCLVNWFDANRRRATPERLLLPDVSGGIETMLGKALSPMGLHARQVDASHWWIGSDATYDRLPVIVASEPLGDRRAAYAEQISMIMNGATRDEFRFTFDPVSDRALMLLPRFVVRQLPKVIERLAIK